MNATDRQIDDNLSQHNRALQSIAR